MAAATLWAMAADTDHRVLADGRVLLDRLRVARRFATRTRGLLGRRSLDRGEALAFREKAVHMLFMRMSLDVVFVDADGRIAKIVSDLRPWRFAGCARSRWVLEMGPGEAARLGLAVGQALEFDPPL